MNGYLFRLPAHLIAGAEKAAAERGVSLDRFLRDAVAEKVGASGGDDLATRARRGDVDAALAVLAAAPDVPPGSDDQWDDETEAPATRRVGGRS